MVEASTNKLDSALSKLKLENLLYKDEARQSLLSKPLKTVFDPDNREREMLNQLLLANPNALDVCTVEDALINGRRDRNTNDVLTDIFIASSEPVREMLANSLNNSAKSIPLILPLETPELCSWQFRNIVRTWQEKKGFREERIFTHKNPIVSFLKLGKPSLSKSMCINKTLFDKNFQVFCDLRSTSSQKKLEHTGMIDAAWCSPQFVNSDENETTEQIMTVLNLHGDGRGEEPSSNKVTEQLKFLSCYSQVMVVFVESDKMFNNHYFHLLSELRSKSSDKENKSSDKAYLQDPDYETFTRMRFVVVSVEECEHSRTGVLNLIEAAQ